MKKIISILLLLLLSLAARQPMYAQDQTPAPPLEPVEQRRHLGELYESKQFYPEAVPNLTVFTFSGDIEVIHNPSIHHVQLDLYVRKGFSLWSGGVDLDDYRILMMQRNGEINASVERKRRGRFWGSDDISFTFIIQTPSAVSTHLRTMKGDILIHDLSGTHRLQTNAGNLAISYSDGEFQVSSTAGNVEVSNSSGQVGIQSTAGHIDLRNIHGEMRVRSTAGAITGSSLTGSLLTRSIAGHVQAEFLHVEEGISIESTAGNIELTLPDDQGFDIDARGLNLNLAGFEDFTGNLQRMSAVGSVGKGSLPVQVHTSAGTILIQKRTGW
ncbi:MAG: DUF4097 family beta strand repeat-containing protein [Balneolaceae bacterium]